MASNPLTELALAAANLKAVSPSYFNDLLSALRTYEVQAIAEILASDEPPDLFRAQGKVKTVQQIRKHLIECTELRETYQRREANGRPVA
jgi:hypothetical protein